MSEIRLRMSRTTAGDTYWLNEGQIVDQPAYPSMMCTLFVREQFGSIPERLTLVLSTDKPKGRKAWRIRTRRNWRYHDHYLCLERRSLGLWWDVMCYVDLRRMVYAVTRGQPHWAWLEETKENDR